MTEKKNKDLWLEIPSFAWVSLARRGMDKISLDQCFLLNCNNQNPELLEPFKKEETDTEEKNIKKIHIRCKKCNGIFQFKLETIKRVAKPAKLDEDRDEEDQALSMGIVYALDEQGNSLGHIGYF